MRRDQRSPEAQAWRAFYNTSAWKRARAAQLSLRPLCERCTKARKITPAGVVNHRKPHKGDWALFIDPTNHESLCKPCHDGPTQQTERTGYSEEVGADGVPSDPNHPFNRG